MSGYIGPAPVPQATQTRQDFTATSGQTTFNTAGYSPGYVDVFLNGVKLAPADYTATNGSDIVLASGAAASDILEVVAYEIFQVADQDFVGDFTVDGSTFVVDSTNNRVGIGTSSPSNTLHVKSSNPNIRLEDSDGASNIYAQVLSDGSGSLFLKADTGGNGSSSRMQFDVDGSERMRIDSSGRVGIGTSSPSDDVEIRTSADAKGLTVKNTGNNRPYLNFDSNRSSAGNNLAQLNFKWNGTDVARIIAVAGSDTTNKDDGHITFSTSSTGSVNERMRIDSSGNVGIGTSSPSYLFHVNGSGDAVAAVTAGASSIAALNLGNSTNLADGGIRYDNSADALQFRAANAERMRIDSSGNLLVGKTTLDYEGTAGLILRNDGLINAARSGGNVTDFNRLSSDGEVVRISKDGTTVGSIGSVASGANLYMSAASGVGLGIGGDNLYPVNASGASTDGSLDIGDSTARFKDLYLSGEVNANTLDIDVNSAGSRRFIANYDDTRVTIKSGNASNNPETLQIIASPIVFRTGSSGSGTERMRITSAGQLLIGRTATSGVSDGHRFDANGFTQHVRDGGSVLELSRETSDGDIQVFKKGTTTVGSIGTSSSNLFVGTGDTALLFDDANNRLTPWNTNNTVRDGQHDLGYSGGRFKDLYLSGGVYVGGTGSANHLDDYEEGTWTPTIPSGVTAATQGGHYTKVGNVVTVMIVFTWSASTSGTEQLKMTLPFTPKSGTLRGALSIGMFTNSTIISSSKILYAQIDPADANIYFRYSQNGSSWAAMTPADMGSTGEIQIGGSYLA